MIASFSRRSAYETRHLSPLATCFLCLLLLGAAACAGGGSRSGAGTVERLAVGDTTVVRNTLPAVLPPPLHILEEDLVIGVEEGPEEYILLNPQAIDVDEEGAIYVSDQRAGEVRIYGSDGTHRVTFGRRGEGPGEFHSNMWGLFDVHPVAGGRLTVEDMPQLRVFNRDGTYRTSFDLNHTISSDERFRVSSYGVRWFPEREQLVASWIWRVQTGEYIMKSRYALVVLDEDLEIVAETPACEPPPGFHSGDQMGFSLPFAADYCHTVTADGRLVWGVSTAYRIDTWDMESEEWLRIEADIAPAPVTAAEIDSFKTQFLERYGQGQEGVWRPLLNQAEYPSRKPVYADFLADDEGRLWVQRYAPVTAPDGAERIRYDIFGQNGEWQGIVDSPATLACISGGAVFWLDYSDYPVIRRARLLR